MSEMEQQLGQKDPRKLAWVPLSFLHFLNRTVKFKNNQERIPRDEIQDQDEKIQNLPLFTFGGDLLATDFLGLPLPFLTNGLELGEDVVEETVLDEMIFSSSTSTSLCPLSTWSKLKGWA